MGDSYPNFLHKMNIIPAASLLFRINIKGVPFVESNGFFIECRRGNYFTRLHLALAQLSMCAARKPPTLFLQSTHPHPPTKNVIFV